MLALLLACSSPAPGDTADTGADTGGDDTAGTAVACPDGWTITSVQPEADGCALGATVSSPEVVCDDEGYRVALPDGASVTLACTLGAAPTCAGDNAGAWWQNTATAAGTLTASSLTLAWTVDMSWSNDEGASTDTCTSTGTLVATP